VNLHVNPRELVDFTPLGPFFNFAQFLSSESLFIGHGRIDLILLYQLSHASRGNHDYRRGPPDHTTPVKLTLVPIDYAILAPGRPNSQQPLRPISSLLLSFLSEALMRGFLAPSPRIANFGKLIRNVSLYFLLFFSGEPRTFRMVRSGTSVPRWIKLFLS